MELRLRGDIKEVYDDGFLVFVPFDDPWKLVKQNIKRCGIIISDGRIITEDQRSHAYALMGDIALYTGHHPDEIKALAKYDFIAKTGSNYFSLSDCDMTTACNFLEYLIDFCIYHDIPTLTDMLGFSPDISRYIYSCLTHKKCCVCRGKAELHHAEDRVGMGRDRKEIIHLGMRAQPLCRKHHKEAHDIGQATFNEKYHIYGLKMDLDLCAIWKVKGK